MCFRATTRARSTTATAARARLPRVALIAPSASTATASSPCCSCAYAQPAYRAVQWMAFGSNSFNALVPLYANVETMPEYYADTQARVTSENFYWANRLIGALADVRFHECGRAVEDYQEKVGGMGHKQIHDVDAAAAVLPEAEVPAELARANEEFAERVRVETDALLGKVLYTTSCAMKNAFAMNDNVR